MSAPKTAQLAGAARVVSRQPRRHLGIRAHGQTPVSTWGPRSQIGRGGRTPPGGAPGREERSGQWVSGPVSQHLGSRRVSPSRERIHELLLLLTAGSPATAAPSLWLRGVFPGQWDVLLWTAPWTEGNCPPRVGSEHPQCGSLPGTTRDVGQRAAHAWDLPSDGLVTGTRLCASVSPSVTSGLCQDEGVSAPTHSSSQQKRARLKPELCPLPSVGPPLCTDTRGFRRSRWKSTCPVCASLPPTLFGGSVLIPSYR